jgi:transposase
MLQISASTRILVAVEPADFRGGIDALARRCRVALGTDPFSGTLFIFCNRGRSAVKALYYDGQGFWLCHKRLSKGRFRWWPAEAGSASRTLRAHELAVLLCGGDPDATKAAALWRPIAAAS